MVLTDMLDELHTYVPACSAVMLATVRMLKVMLFSSGSEVDILVDMLVMIISLSLSQVNMAVSSGSKMEQFSSRDCPTRRTWLLLGLIDTEMQRKHY